MKYLSTLGSHLINVYKIHKLLNCPFAEAFLVVDYARRATIKTGESIANDAKECYKIARVAVKLGAKKDYSPMQSLDFAFNAIRRCDSVGFEALGLGSVERGCNGKEVFNKLTKEF